MEVGAKLRNASTAREKRFSPLALWCLSAAAGLTALLLGAESNAQSAMVIDDSERVEEVVVTARKRDEALSEVPVAVTSFSESNITSIGLRNLEDISVFTPGLHFSKQGDQLGGRSETVVRFRGMSINDISPVRQLASVFEDGIFVSGGAASISLDDVERVEVIKGPQSAYFGRSTFGGAVNFITKKPSLTEMGGEARLTLAENNEYDGSIALEVPLIAEKLAARVTGRVYSTDGAFRSAVDGHELGAEKTKSVALTLLAAPHEDLELKVRYFHSEDDDGLSPTFALGPPYYNCGPFFEGGKRFICGEVPVVRDIELNSRLVGTARDVFINNSVGSPTIASSPLPMDHLGLAREVSRLSFAGDWSIGDTPYTVSMAAAKNSMKQMRMTDTDHTGQMVWVESNFQDSEDSAVELRLAYSGARMSWMAGVSSFSLDHRAPTGATVGWLFPNSFAPDGFFFDQTVSLTQVETLGFFGSFNYSITDTVNISVEGRYQEDKISETAPLVSLSKSFTNFLPRLILQWRPGDDTNLYLTYAEGNMPGNFNGNILQFDETQRQQIFAQTGATEFIDEGQLENFEIGLKQFFNDRRVFVAAAAYYMEWMNQQNRTFAIVDDPASPVGFRNVPIVVSTAQTNLWGLELESTWSITDKWRISAAYNWAASEIQKFICQLCVSVLGTTDVSGNKLARFPEHSGVLSVDYQDHLVGGWDWFARSDAIYTGNAWEEVFNLAESPEYWVVNLRTGVESRNWRLEAFVLNAFDDHHYTGIARSADFTKGNFDISDYVAVVTPGQPRQFGVRALWRF